MISNILNILWGQVGRDDVPEDVRRLWGICANGFDVISCQFAFHYMCENKKSIDFITQIITDNLKDDG